MLLFELLYRDIDSLEFSNLNKEFVKSRLRDPAFSSYKDTGKTSEKTLVPILVLPTTNEYTIKGSFTFAEELQSFDSKLVIASFDIE